MITGVGCPDAWQWIDTESPNIFVVSVGSVIHVAATVKIDNKKTLRMNSLYYEYYDTSAIYWNKNEKFHST